MICCLNPNCSQPHNPDHQSVCQSCGTPLIPLLRGHYRILKPLGRGGFGRTYLAEDIDKINEPCVVKQLAPYLQGTWALNKSIELFEQEAKQLQQLGEHPQIPSLYAYFEESGYFYLVQQFIEGENLAQNLQKQGNWSEERVLNLLLNLLPVLQFVHEKQVIHRDIKPENIICRHSPQSNLNSEQFVLIDFGVSKQLSASVLGQPGTTLGSQGYAAFEQMQKGDAYPASDLFSLGVTCFHLLTQIHPFQLWTEHGYSWTTNWQQSLVKPIHPILAQVLNKLLEKDVQNRYQSASSVLRDLEPIAPRSHSTLPTQLLTSQPSLSSLKSTIITPKKSSKKIGLLIAIPLLIAGLGAASWYSFIQQNRSEVEEEPIETLQEPVFKEFAIAQTLTGHTNAVYTLAISPDGQTLVSGGNDKLIKIWDLTTGQLKKTLSHHTQSVNSVAISADGKTLVSGSGDRTIAIWDLETGTLRNTIKGLSYAVFAVAISPDGNTLFSGSSDNSVKVWDLKTGTLKLTLNGHSKWVRSLAITPDGETLVSASEDNIIRLWNLQTVEVKNTFSDHKAAVRSLAIGSDGETLISGSSDNTIMVWNLKTGAIKRTIEANAGYILSTAITPDGLYAIAGTGDDTIKIWNLKTGELKQTLSGHQDDVWSVAIAPDGQTIVSGSADQTIKVWRLQN